MSIKELETLKKFIDGNNSFYRDIKTQKISTLSTAVKFELIIIYFINNKKYLRELNEHNILELINTQDFTLEEDFLLFKSNCLSLDYLISIVNRIEEYKRNLNRRKIILINFGDNQSTKSKVKQSENDCKIYNFDALRKNDYFKMRERSILFEHGLKIDRETTPYIAEVNRSFNELLNDIIIRGLNNQLEDYNLVYLKVLYSYLSLYPFSIYLKDKENVPYEKLELAQNEISIRKTTHSNAYLLDLENRIKRLEKRRQAIQDKKYFLENTGRPFGGETMKLQRQLFSTEKEIINLSLDVYCLRENPEIYNENLISYIVKAFTQGNIDINKMFENPIIKLFCLKNNKVEFYCAMQLNTLVSLLDNEKLLSLITDVKKLKKEV